MRILFTILLFVFVFSFSHAQVLINEIYGGGGNIGATWTHDVVQLKNISGSTVDLTGYAIQYASEGGSSWNVDLIPAGTTIGSGAILNVMLISGVNGATPPAPSIQALAGAGGLINMAVRSGKVALTSNTTALTGSACPTSAVDYVGYGNTGTQTCGPHTTATIGAGDNTKGYIRTDTNVPGSFDIYNTPLPVTFSDFSLNKTRNNKVDVQWSTAAERNNHYFNIERSSNGSRFEVIGEMRGAGNSSRELKYSFIDENPLNGISYYRIKQTDFDGQYSYSDVRRIKFVDFGNLSLKFGMSQSQLNISSAFENYSIHIYNTSGIELRKNEGLSLDHSMSIDDLQSGIYFLRIQSEGQSVITKIVKI